MEATMEPLSKKAQKIFDGLQARKAADNTMPAAPPALTIADRFVGMDFERASGRAFMKIANIIPDPTQPRKDITKEEIAQLARSLKAEGQLQPLRVEWNEEFAKWQIEDGERRWLAAVAAEMDRVWVMFILKKTPEDERLRKQLISEALRAGLKPIERAKAYQRLMVMRQLTQQQLAAELHIDQSSVSVALKLLEQPAEVQAALASGEMTVKELRAKAPRKRKKAKGSDRKLAIEVEGGTITFSVKRGKAEEQIDAMLAEAVEQRRQKLAAA